MRLLFMYLWMAIIMINVANGQQQPMYSQYMFNMLNINPAYAGNREASSITILHRNQWIGFPGAPITGTVTYDARLLKKENGELQKQNVGYGVQLYYDQLGVEKTTGVQGFYAYKIPFTESSLSLGLSFGFLNYTANMLNTNPYQPGDPLAQNVINGLLPTAGFGMLFAKDNWYVSLSTPALFETKINILKPRDFNVAGNRGHYFMNIGFRSRLSEDIILRPSFLLKTIGLNTVQYDANIVSWYKEIMGVGFSYRHRSSIVSMVELQLNSMIRLGYAFDANLANSVPYNKGTHELMVRFELGTLDGFGFLNKK